MVAIDTNLLLYAFHPGAPGHASARAALEQAAARPGGWGFAVANAIEFWSVATRPVDGVGMATVDEAGAFLASLVRSGAAIWQGQADFGPRLLAAAGRNAVAGRRIFDLQIALAALDNGAAELWTHDRGFVRLPGLPVVDPLAGD